MSARRADIEGLRAVAILLVILYHAGVPAFSGGFVGVDVFFALSGYLITGLLLTEIRSTGGVDLVGFYSRRARRLLPAAALTIVASLAAVWWLLGPLDQMSYTGTALASAIYLSNVWFGLNATDYLAAPPDTNPFLHLWSLAVEEQFYLVWPVLLLLIWRWASPRATLVFTALCAASFALTLALQQTGGAHWAFFASPPRAWEFGVGAVGALGTWRLPGWTAWLGLVAIGLPAVAYGPLTPFPGVAALPPVVGTVLVLVAADATVVRGLAMKPLQWIGALSYGWYLWHWPVLVVARTLVPGLGVWAGLACSVVALGLAAATFRLVEGPIRHNRWLAGRPRATLVGTALLTAAVVLLCVVWRGQVRAASADGRQARFLQAREEMPQIYSAGCHLDPEATTIRECVYGAADSPTTIVLWGDSHAAQWFPALERAATLSGWRLVPMTKSGCPPADIAATPSCETWRKAAVAAIHAMAPALVLLANANVYLDGADSRLLRVTPADFRAAARRTLESLAGVSTGVILPVPRPAFDVPMCLARADWRPWLGVGCDIAPVASPTRGLELEAAAGLPHVRVLDFTTAVCATTPCPAEVDGEIVYRDDNHLTPRFSSRLSPEMAGAVAPLLRGQAAP